MVGLGGTTRVRRRGIVWQLDLGEGIDFAIYLLGAFEAATQRDYRRLLKPGATVLDIGANIGAHTLPLAKLVGDHGHVFAFEPTAFAFNKLQANIALNPTLAARITAEQIALGDAADAPLPGMIAASWPLSTSDERDPLHGGRAMSTVGARATALDAYVEASGVSRLDFIKLDVDGAECRVLRGAKATLARFRPAIVLELAPYVFDGTGDDLATLLGLLNQAGYSLLTAPGGAALPMTAEVLAARIPTGSSLNAWALAA